MNPIIQEVKTLFALKGQVSYGENITQQEHAVQCYLLANERNASLALKVAAFLHDIGHLAYLPADGKTSDMHHEDLGARMVEEWGFGPKVAALIRSHVWAKRYLVTHEPYYLNRLSAASLKSLSLQGGLLTPDESEAYRQQPYFEECLDLRRWDDAGKRVDLILHIPDVVWLDLNDCLETKPE